MQTYNLKFLLLGGPKTGKSTILNKLRGYDKHDEMIMMEQYQWFIDGKIVNGIIQDLQSIDLMSAVVTPFLKDSAIIIFCYDPDRMETVDFLDTWMKNYFRFIPASSIIYIISTKKNKRSVKVRDLHSVYFCCKHMTVDIQNTTDVEKMFEEATYEIMQYATRVGKENIPGLKKQRPQRSYCMWW